MVEVLREGRRITITNGVIADTFAPQAVHVYTTVTILPRFESPEAVWAEIQGWAKTAIATGNLLVQPGLRYRISGSRFNMDGSDPTTDRFQVADGNKDQNAWTEGDMDGKACKITFEKPVTFTRLTMSSPTILTADLEAEVDGKWRTLTSWVNNEDRDFEWQGDAVTVRAIRINARDTRIDGSGPARAGITELGLFDKETK